jgi:hypothetical protein
MTRGQFNARDLGPVWATFTPFKRNIVAGSVLSALIAIGGASAVVFPLLAAYRANWNLPVNVQKGWCWLAVGVFCLLGAGLIVGGALLAKYTRGLTSHRVELCENGFRRGLRDSIEHVFWDDVVCVRETILYERPPILKPPAIWLLPEMASSRYKIVTASGKEHDFDGNSIGEIKRFGKIIREFAAAMSLRWETVEDHN